MSNNLEFLQANWKAPSQIKTLITTRNGGYSQDNFSSLNLGVHVNDSLELVKKNRELLNKFLPHQPLWLNQIHSNKVEIITNYANHSPSIDAAITWCTDLPLVIQTADCLPILLTDKLGTFVAAIHAGRSGLESLILENTINLIKQKVNPYDLIAYFGPSVSQKNYEVGDDIYNKFIQVDRDFTDCFIAKPNNNFLCDLPQIAKLQLVKLGLNLGNIYLSNLCTFDLAQQFFSYRRDRLTGRFATFIWKTNTKSD